VAPAPEISAAAAGAIMAAAATPAAANVPKTLKSLSCRARRDVSKAAGRINPASLVVPRRRWSDFAWCRCTINSAAHSVCSPPPCWEGLGVGVVRLMRRRCHTEPPPSPALPHKGGGSTPSLWLALMLFHQRPRSDLTLRRSGGHGLALVTPIGRWAVKVAPCPSTLSIVSRPPWRLRMCLTSARPSPVPPCARLSETSTR
jgi:hypothetical protein